MVVLSHCSLVAYRSIDLLFSQPYATNLVTCFRASKASSLPEPKFILWRVPCSFDRESSIFVSPSWTSVIWGIQFLLFQKLDPPIPLLIRLVVLSLVRPRRKRRGLR